MDLDRERLLDELGLVFARAAVDRLLEGGDVTAPQKCEGPAPAQREALRSSSTQLPDGNDSANPPSNAT